MPPTLEPFPPGRPALEHFLSSWPFKPHRWAGRDAADGLDGLAASRVGAALENAQTRSWSALDGGQVVGLATLYPLGWDSEILGMAAARLELYVHGSYPHARRTAEALIAAAVGDARNQHLRHVSVRVDAADDPSIHALESAGFLNVDALTTFGAGVGDLPPAPHPDGLTLREATIADAGAIGALAGRAFHCGRFHSDPAIRPEQAREVYRAWAASCCGGPAADATILAEIGARPAGFVACRMLHDTAVHLRRPTGTIPLIASDTSDRGRGLGSILVAAAAEWFRAEQAAVVEVGTQLRNIPAARLYERCGFRLVAGSLSFRLMIET